MDKSTVAITARSYINHNGFTDDHFMTDEEAREQLLDAMHDDYTVKNAIDYLHIRGFTVDVDEIFMSIEVPNWKYTKFYDLKDKWEREAWKCVTRIAYEIEWDNEEYLAFFEGEDPEVDQERIVDVLVKYGMYKQLKGLCDGPDASVLEDLVSEFSKPEVFEDYKKLVRSAVETNV